MARCKVLKPFTEVVPGVGMVVANVGKNGEDNFVNLPINLANQRKDRGFVEFDDAEAAAAEEADRSAPRTRKEMRLAARAERRAQRDARQGREPPAPKAVEKAPAPKRSSSRSSGKVAKKPKAAKPKSELGALRAEFKALSGKAPSPKLKADELKAKIAEFSKGGSAAAGVKSDAPID